MTETAEEFVKKNKSEYHIENGDGSFDSEDAVEYDKVLVALKMARDDEREKIFKELMADRKDIDKNNYLLLRNNFLSMFEKKEQAEQRVAESYEKQIAGWRLAVVDERKKVAREIIRMIKSSPPNNIKAITTGNERAYIVFEDLIKDIKQRFVSQGKKAGDE